MLLRVCPPILFAPLKLPPTKILPSVWTAMALTVSFAFGLKAVSSVPSGFSRAMRLRVTGAPPLGESVGKIAADQNLAVRLDDGDGNPAVGVRIETVERGLSRGPASR